MKKLIMKFAIAFSITLFAITLVFFVDGEQKRIQREQDAAAAKELRLKKKYEESVEALLDAKASVERTEQETRRWIDFLTQ